MIRRRLSLVAGLLSIPAGVVHAQDDGMLRVNVRSVEKVRFYSDISQEAVDRYAHIVLPEEIVEIQSRGGDLAAALTMADVSVRLGARFHVVGGLGQCRDECALVWLAGSDRIGPDFVPVFFDGGALPWTEAVAFRPEIATEPERAEIAAAAEGWDRLLAARGIAPWLQTCAWRLRNVRFDAYPPEVPLHEAPVRERLRITADFDAVWFPKSVLEAAGVTGLATFDPPSEVQRERHSPLRPEGRPGRILWAEDTACDLERQAVDRR